MSIYLSPGVYSQEKNISDIVRRVATAPAALVGYSAKGDTANITLMTTDQQFIEEYGEPDPSTGHYFHYAALAYLKKGNALYCLRVDNGALWGGVDIMSSVSLEDSAAFTAGASSAAYAEPTGYDDDVLFQIVGKNPGVWNNRIGVVIQNIKDGTDLVPTDQYTFEILVYWQDDDGNWAQVETHKVSRKQKVDGYGKQLYMEDKVNGLSKYIYLLDSAIADTVVPEAVSTRLNLASGSDGSTISASDVITGWNQFLNPDAVDIRILINGGETDVTTQTAMRDVAEARNDCLAILDVPYSTTVSSASMVLFRTTTQNFNTSYATLYGPWPKIHDSYNDLLIRIPPSGYVAAQYAYNDQVGAVWQAPAGGNRGVIDDAIEITLSTGEVLTEGDRDVMNPASVNAMQTFHGEGHMIYGQRTLQSKLSALSYVNVRRLLIVIEKSMAVSLRPFVFENNNDLTRFRVEAMLNSYLDPLSAQGAFQTEANDKGFYVECNTDNNTPDTIDAGELRVDVFVKPARAIEFIRLRTIVSSTKVSFEEISSRGGLL